MSNSPGSRRGRGAASAERLAQSFGFEPVSPREKATRVGGVFDRVARRYDLMNDVMSAGVHRLWKDAMVDWLMPRPGLHYVDLAGGTADIAFRIMRRIEHEARVTLIDINPSMLSVGRDRALDGGLWQNLEWIAGDAMRLPLAEQSVDAVTIAFGIRNVTHIDRALREARRVLKPGGRFLCLEFSQVSLPMLERLYDLYSFNVVPVMGMVIARDRASYRYLVESIRNFPDQEAMVELMRDAGFDQVKYRNLSAGIAAIHSGWRL